MCKSIFVHSWQWRVAQQYTQNAFLCFRSNNRKAERQNIMLYVHCLSCFIFCCILHFLTIPVHYSQFFLHYFLFLLVHFTPCGSCLHNHSRIFHYFFFLFSSSSVCFVFWPIFLHLFILFSFSRLRSVDLIGLYAVMGKNPILLS